MDILFQMDRLPLGQGLQWPSFNMLLLRRIIDAGYVQIHQTAGAVFVMGMKSSPDLLTITDKGKEFLREIASDEIS